MMAAAVEPAAAALCGGYLPLIRVTANHAGQGLLRCGTRQLASPPAPRLPPLRPQRWWRRRRCCRWPTLTPAVRLSWRSLPLPLPAKQPPQQLRIRRCWRW